MSNKDYILKEKKLMEKDCKKMGISPEEWVSRFAVVYYEKYASKILTQCFEDYK